jgi:hypothetical protein
MPSIYQSVLPENKGQVDWGWAGNGPPRMSDFDPRSDLRGIVANLHTPFADDNSGDEPSLARRALGLEADVG